MEGMKGLILPRVFQLPSHKKIGLGGGRTLNTSSYGGLPNEFNCTHLHLYVITVPWMVPLSRPYHLSCIITHVFDQGKTPIF